MAYHISYAVVGGTIITTLTFISALTYDGCTGTASQARQRVGPARKCQQFCLLSRYS